MIVENMESLKALIKIFYPDEKLENSSIEKISEVLQKDGDRVHRLTNFRQSQASKTSWQKKRFNFMAGINRYNRNQKPDIQRKVASTLKNRGSLDTSGDKVESYVYSVVGMGYLDLFEFLGDISTLEAHVYNTAGTFALEEQYIESAILARDIIDDIYEFKKRVLSGEPIPSNIMESVLILAGDYVGLNESSVKQDTTRSLWEIFVDAIKKKDNTVVEEQKKRGRPSKKDTRNE